MHKISKQAHAYLAFCFSHPFKKGCFARTSIDLEWDKNKVVVKGRRVNMRFIYGRYKSCSTALCDITSMTWPRVFSHILMSCGQNRLLTLIQNRLYFLLGRNITFKMKTENGEYPNHTVRLIIKALRCCFTHLLHTYIKAQLTAVWCPSAALLEYLRPQWGRTILCVIGIEASQERALLLFYFELVCAAMNALRFCPRITRARNYCLCYST